MTPDFLSRLRTHFFGQPGEVAEPSIVQRISKGTFWSLIGELALKGFTLASSIYVARRLGHEDFGTFGILQSTFVMMGVYAGFGLGSTTTRYVAQYYRTDPDRAGGIAMLTLTLGALTAGAAIAGCIALAPWLAESILGRQELSGLLMLGSLVLAGLVIGGVLNATLSGIEAFRTLTRIKLWQGLLGALTAVLLVWQWGVGGAVLSTVIAATLGMLLAAQAVRRHFMAQGIPLIWDKRLLRDWHVVYRYALPALLGGQFVLPAIWVANVMLVQQPGGFGELGLFNAANQWRTFVVFLPALLGNAMLPILSETYARADRSDFGSALAINLRATWVVALPVTVAVIALGPELSGLFGKQFVGMERILPLLMVSTFLSTICGPVGAAMAASGNMWTAAVMNLGWAGILIAAAWMLVPSMGGAGLATAYLSAYMLHTLWVMSYVGLKLAPGLFTALRRLMAASIMLLTACLVLNAGIQPSNRYIFIGLLALSCIPLGMDIRRLVARLYMNTYASKGKKP